jgi:hypothetical protein
MHAVLKMMTWPLVRPSLGLGAIVMAIAYGSFFLGAALLKPDFRLLLLLPSIPLFWVSLRVLLRVGRSPNSICGSVVFAMLLLSLLLGLGGVISVIVALCHEL